MAEEAKKTSIGKGLGIAGMVVGIVALVFCWTPFFGLICGIVATVLSIIYLVKKGTSKAFPIVGIITGALGLIISFFVTLAFFAAASLVETTIKSDGWGELENWANEMNACLEKNGLDGLDYEDMTDAQQDIYWDCI